MIPCLILFHYLFGGITTKKMKMLLKKIHILILAQLVGLTFCNIYAQTVSSELAYLQTDRTVYVAGESVYYKLYVLEASTNKCSKISKVGYVVLRATNSIPTLKIRVQINDGMADGRFTLPDTLSSGLYQLVAFTGLMKNRGEDNFFHNEITIVSPFDNVLNFKMINSALKESSHLNLQNVESEIRTNKTVFAPHEKVTVSIKIPNLKATASVSVFEESQIPSTYKSIAEVLKYPNAAQNSKQILNYYSPEKKGKILRGIVIDSITQKSIKNAIVLLSCVDSVPNLQYAVTNSNGLFQMLLSDYYNGKELFLTIKNVPENQKWKIEIDDEFALSEKWNPSLIPGNGNYKEFIIKSQNLAYINESYQLNNDTNVEQIIKDKLICPQFYHGQATTILPSDFTPLPDFLEITVEILPMVRITKENGKYRAQMFNDLLRQFDLLSPAIFLDGVFVDDINKIIKLESEQIKKIDIFANQRAFGDLIFGGLISITSKRDEITNTKPASYSLRIKNDEVSRGANFVAVNPDTIQNKKIPFIKQLLYWNPNLKLNGTESSDFEFYTSDNLANFIIKVEGISQDGTPISISSRIQVTDKN